MSQPRWHLFAAVALTLVPLCGMAADPGITKDEIRIGTIQDLSGPLAAYSKETLNGMNMRIGESNAVTWKCSSMANVRQ